MAKYSQLLAMGYLLAQYDPLSYSTGPLCPPICTLLSKCNHSTIGVTMCPQRGIGCHRGPKGGCMGHKAGDKAPILGQRVTQGSIWCHSGSIGGHRGPYRVIGSHRVAFIKRTCPLARTISKYAAGKSNIRSKGDVILHFNVLLGQKGTLNSLFWGPMDIFRAFVTSHIIRLRPH